MSGSWDRGVFDRIYARGEDPWDFQGSAYEIAKYDQTLSALPRERFACGLEVGCSIGVQTRRLAERCDRLLALDLAPAAVARAGARCADLAQVTVQLAQVPRDWPPGTYDLIVLSEVLYFLDRADLASVARLVLGSLRADGSVLLVNWTGPTDTPTTGDEAAQAFVAATASCLAVRLHRQDCSYRLDVLGRGRQP